MAFKIKHIGNRFILQAIFAIILVSTLVFVLVLSSNRKKDTNKAISAAENISADILQLNSNLSRAFAAQKTDADFAALTADELISTQTKLVNHIYDSIYFLKNLNYLHSKFKGSAITDSLKEKLRLYNHAFEMVVLSLKTKGNRYSGLVANAYERTNELINELRLAPDKGLLAAQLEIVSINYYNQLDLASLNHLRDYSSNISSSFTDYPSFDPSLIDESAAQLNRLLTDIEQIDLHLSNPDLNKGEITDLTNLFNQVLILRTKLLNTIHTQTAHYTIWWNFMFVIIALILAGAYLFLMFRFRQNVTLSVEHVVNSTNDLLSGDFRTNNGIVEHFEFNTISSNINTFKSLLNERQEFIEKLLGDNFTQNITFLGDNDEFTKKLVDLREKLQKAQEEQLKRNKENEIRRYFNEGLAKFGDIMRLNSSDTQALGDNLVKELVKYLGAIQGGIFIADENDADKLNLITAFAYDRKKYLTKTIKVGEGLVGTCAIERKTINLIDVPKEYVIIRSGLGDTPPNNILLLPVLHEDDLVGVIELASLKVLDEHEVELAELIASNLASTIITVRNNTRTAQLLEKSQQQAIEMSEQEEEMRQNMEELKATQEESARREEEMLGLLNTIENSFFIIEYSVNGSIIHVNEKLLKFLSEPYESLIGKKHQEIFSSSSLINSALFADIESRKEIKSITETLPWGSKQYTYKHNISPVLSKQGDIIKILNLLTIEEAKLS
jgi:hypothetical protein